MFWVQLLDMPRPKNPWIRELPGIAMVLGYFLVTPALLAKTLFKTKFLEMGVVGYNITMHMLLWFALMPIKMALRWTVNLKYFVSIPEYFFNV